MQIDLNAARDELEKSLEHEKEWRGMAGAHERALAELAETLAKERSEATAKFQVEPLTHNKHISYDQFKICFIVWIAF